MLPRGLTLWPLFPAVFTNISADFPFLGHISRSHLRCLIMYDKERVMIDFEQSSMGSLRHMAIRV